MKKTILIFLIAFISLSSFAQRGKKLPENEEIQNKRVSFLALRLDLTMEEAIYFKEKYLAYEGERKAIIANFETKKRRPSTEEQAKNLIQLRFQAEEETMAAKRQFYEELSREISSLKLITLPKAEEEFKQILIQRLRENRRKGG